jgi:hypothetical protein
MPASRSTHSRLALAAAACGGVAAWLSLGSLAVASTGSGVLRFGFLPALWLLPLFVLAFTGIAWLVRLSPATALPMFLSVVLFLPWLPFRVPAAFLIWTGHITAAVWLAVAAGMLAAHGIRPFAWVSDARRAPRLAALIACALYLITGFRLVGLIPGGDEPHYLVITQSLLKDGDLKIENNHTQGDYREYFPGRLAPDFLRRGTNGQIYSVHAPGLPAVVAPAFALFGYSGVAVFLSIVAAIGTALLWRASYLLTGSSGAAWFGWAAGALTVPFFFQSFAVYPDGIGATFVLFAVLPLVEEPRHIGKARWFAIGVDLALLPWLHTRFAVLAAAMGVTLALRLIGSPEGRSRLAVLVAAPLVSAPAWFGFFRAIYGTFNPSAPYGGDTQSTPANILNGMSALFFDQQFGVLPYAPVYAVCIGGLVALGRRRPRLALELLAIVVPYLLVTSMFHMWWAGSVSPARLLVPLLPLLAVPGAWLWKDARHAATRAIAIALLLVSISITLSLVVVDAGRLVYNFRDGYSLAAERLSPLVDLPQGMPSFFRQSVAGAVLRAAIWLAAMSGAWMLLRIVERRSLLALATPACLAAALMIALSAVWRLDGVAAATAETSQLSLLAHYNPRLRPLGLSLAPPAIESPEHILSRIAIATPTRRPAPPAHTLLVAPGIVPAGTYELRPRNPSAPNGTARLVIGRLAKPIRTWNLGTDLRDGALAFDLPVNVGSLVVEGDDAAVEAGGFTLVPTRIVSGSARLTDGYARRVQQYGPALAFFFDDGAFPEEPGVWIRGNAESTIAVTLAEPGAVLQLFLRNAPVKNRLTVDVDGERSVIELQPGEERTLPLQVSGTRAASLIRFRTDTGFRPSEVEPGSTDNRFLGTWVEFRKR